ncbi:MAG: Vps62-related protein [Caldilineaceae bacterium]
MSQQFTAQTVDPALIQQFAPKIYLHPYDKNHPDAVEAYFKTVFLKKDGVVLATTVNADTLRQYNEESCYLEFANGEFPTAENDFETGAPIVPSGQPNVGATNAPVYVKTFTYDTHIDIKYIFFYPFQGFQTFRVGILHGFSTKKRNFEWARFGRHEGDWEHITVRLTPALQLQGVFYGQHGDSVWVEKPPLIDGTHPVVLSALNDHASYWTADTFAKDNIIDPPGLLPIGWLKAADTTVTDGLVTYHPPQTPYTVVEWTPYRQPEQQLINLDANEAAAPWLDFLGHWGPPKLDNTHIDRPPAMPESVQDRLFDWAKILTSAIPEKYFYGDGPQSPKQQGWWNGKEP